MNQMASQDPLISQCEEQMSYAKDIDRCKPRPAQNRGYIYYGLSVIRQ